MKTEIFYFSGTGNSLWVAQKIRDKIQGAKLISIPNAIKQEEGIKGDTVGIVCPIYMYNIPHLVADFIGKIESAEYIFLVYAGAGELGGGVKDTFKLFASQSLKLSALINVPMPNNYTPYDITPEDQQKELFDNLEVRVEEIVQIVKNRRNFADSSNTSFFRATIYPGILYRLGYNRINIMDQEFIVDKKCTGCGICKSVCPVNNISIEKDKPVWHKNCQQCYACLQWCPEEAIEYGNKTQGIERYHNPYITVKDIIQSSAE